MSGDAVDYPGVPSEWILPTAVYSRNFGMSQELPRMESWQLANQVLSELRNLPLHKVRQELDEQRKEIATLKQAVAQIQRMLAEPESVNPDAFISWLSSSESKNYAGMEVAFVPGVGVIESDATPEGLLAKLANNPNAGESAIASVPHGAF